MTGAALWPAKVTGCDISLNSLSGLILKLVTAPGLQVRESLGASRG